MEIIPRQVCQLCNKEKFIFEFYILKNCKRRNNCAECEREKRKNYRSELSRIKESPTDAGYHIKKVRRKNNRKQDGGHTADGHYFQF